MVNNVQGSNPLSAGQPLSSALNAKPAAAAGKPSQAASLSDAANTPGNTQDRFLKLLVTQMKNQDPLNPMDNAQVTSQMAQLSTVSGIDKVNATLKSLTDSLSAGQAMSATGMIGHGALVPGSAIDLKNGQSVAGVNLEQGADSLKVLIKDGANNLVRTLDMGAQKQGVVPVAWDGKDNTGKAMADGAYKISAEVAAGEKTTAATTLSFGTVNGVAPGSGGAKLDMGKLGAFNLADIKQVM